MFSCFIGDETLAQFAFLSNQPTSFLFTNRDSQAGDALSENYVTHEDATVRIVQHHQEGTYKDAQKAGQLGRR